MSVPMTFPVWLVFVHDGQGGEELLGAFSTEEKAVERVHALARERGWLVTLDEEGRPCVRGTGGGAHVKALDVE